LRNCTLIKLNCHCGNVCLEFAELPETVRDCDCPICNRLGALWGDFDLGDVSVVVSEPTTTYSWGDHEYEMHHCATCGCTTHYTGITESTRTQLGINLRMLDRSALEQIPIGG